MIRKLPAWLVAISLLSLGLLAYPLYVIRPFRYQGEHELALALFLLRFQPWVETLFAIAVISLLVLSWPVYRRRLQRAGLALAALLVLACAVLARMNIYEHIFHPIERAQFSPALQSPLDGAEQVIAVRINDVARAYPIRSMSYHHMVNDTLSGVPIIATY